MSSLFSRTCDAIVSVIGSVYSEDDPGKDKPDAIWLSVVHPVTQAGFVFLFTAVTTTLYVVSLWSANERNRIPADWKFYALLLSYVVIWLSFHLERFSYLADRRLGIASGREIRVQTDSLQWPPPDIEIHSQYYKVKTGVAIRVFLLVASSIVIACWLTLYSGGPFQSAYSQVIIAYPLFATNIARNRESLAAVYIFTFCAMAVAEVIKFKHFSSYATQGILWYGGVAMLLLFASWLVAYDNRKAIRQADQVAQSVHVPATK